MLIHRAVPAAVVLWIAMASSAQAQESPGAPQGLMTEPDVIERTVIFVDRRHANGELTEGMYWDAWNMIPGAGWLSGGPGYRRWLAADRVFWDASGAVSWSGYKSAQARLELPRIARGRMTLGSQVRWHDFGHVSFFGGGPASRRSDHSEYRIRSRQVSGYVGLRTARWASIGAQIGWVGPEILGRSGWFEGDHRDTRDVFPADPMFALSHQPSFVQREASVTADTRDVAGHPTRGGLYRAAAASYAASSPGFSFTRYEAEATHFVPIAQSRLVVALHGWLVGSDTADGHVVPFYFQPSLGGHNTLRSFADYRFHDRNLIVVNAEGRVAVMTHVDAAVFVDAGGVAPRLAMLTLGERSYGAGLRLHTRRKTFARLDVAHGREGWRLVFRLNDPLESSRLSRKAAVAAPFVP